MSGDVANSETTPTAALSTEGDSTGDQSLLNAPPKCWGCHKAIDGGSAIQFADGVWHIDCFQCTTCGKVIEFDSNLLFLADGKPICPECSYCCSLCKKPIFDEAIVTVEGTYHSECFRCTNCKHRIQGKSFAKTSQGVIYCVLCYAERRERKKAARRRRDHQVPEEKMLPSLPFEAAATANEESTSVKSPDSSMRDSEPQSAASNTTTQTPLSTSTTGSPRTSMQQQQSLAASITSMTTATAGGAMSSKQKAAGKGSDERANRHKQEKSQDARTRRRGVHTSADFSGTSEAANTVEGADNTNGHLPPAPRGMSAGSTLQTTVPEPEPEHKPEPEPKPKPEPKVEPEPEPQLSAPTTPVKPEGEFSMDDLLPLPAFPQNPSATDPILDVNFEWTEDIGALEDNFVRFSMRAPLAPKPDTSNKADVDKRQLAKQRRREAEFGNSPRPGSHYHVDKRTVINRSSSFSRARAASSASLLGNLVPPGLRSRENTTTVLQQQQQQQNPEDSAAGSANGSNLQADSKEWLNTATVKQLKDELLVNYGQLCRMEASYQKLRDLYATVIDQLLVSRESLQQERTKRLEYENILHNFYGYVATDAPGADKGPSRQASIRHRGGASNTVLPALALGQASSAKQQQARGQVPKQQQQQQRGESSVIAPAPPAARQPSLRRQRQTRKHDGPHADHANDSGSDAEDAIITTVPQKATKRFMWPFGGNRANGDEAQVMGHQHHQQHERGTSEDSTQHSFHVASTFRASKCDHCQDRLKTFSNTVVRCRNCGFVCHQKCAADVTATCASFDSATGRQSRPSASSTNNVVAGNPLVYDPNVPFQADKMFGRDLCEQAAMEDSDVPWIVRAAIKFIETEGLTMEGVYRRSGSTMDIRAVQVDISRVAEATGNKFFDTPIADSDVDVTSVTSVLKQYFRDLPNPLMTSDTYHLWVQAANIGSAEERIKVYRTISDSMPRTHSETLRFLMSHLKLVADNQAENKMTTNNLSVVFAPNILHMGKNDVLQEMANMSGINKTVSFLIQHADDIWGDAHYAKYSENTMGVAADGAADGNASVSDLAFAPPMSSVDAVTDAQTTGPFAIPPMTRRKMNVGGIGIDITSSPSSPTQQRYNPYYQQQQHSVAMDMDGDTQEGTSMSHSMPSPKGLCFDKNELMPSDRVSSQYKTANNGGGAYQKYSFDIPRK